MSDGPCARAQPPSRTAAAMRRGTTAAAATLRTLGPVRYAIADVIGMGGWAADRSRRRNAERNHLRLGAPTSREARRRTRACFREYARTSVDFIWGMSLTQRQVRQQSRLDGLDHILEAQAAGRGAVVALSHFGNWDFAALVSWALGLRLTTVMAPIGGPAITDLVIWARQRNSVEVYTPEHAGRGLVRALRSGRFVALLCDIPGAGPETAVRFCGGSVMMSLAPAWLALRCRVPLIPLDCRRGRRGEPRYVVTAQAPLVPEEGEEAEALTQRLATALEGPVRRHPEQWYPFGRVFVVTDSPEP